MQRIIVKNFGPLKDIDLEIKDYMIFIGPQASGKSTLAKLIYFGKNIGREIVHNSITFIRNPQKRPYKYIDNEELLSFFTYNFLLEFFEVQYFKVPFEIQIFYSNQNSIKFNLDESNNTELTISDGFSKKYLNLLVESVNNFDHKFNNLGITSRLELAIEELANLTYSFFNHPEKIYFIPASRSLFTILSNQIFSIKTENLDYLTKVFFDEINFLKLVSDASVDETFSIRYYDKLNIFKTLTKAIIKGTYTFQFENPCIQIDSGEILSLKDTSSGQQEAVWITRVIISNLRDVLSAIIEEPEAHLYPEAQKDMTYLISLLANQESNQVVITTHSPYILASLNNLIYAYKKGQIDPETVEKVIPKELWVNPERLFVGEMQNGEIKEIIHPETGLIEVERLDRVSEDLGEDFEKLYEIHEPTLSV
jgi:predicted ATPase